jgi:hypothetical protein
MADQISGVPNKLEIKASELSREKISEINKILERILAEKGKITTAGIFDLHVSL